MKKYLTSIVEIVKYLSIVKDYSVKTHYLLSGISLLLLSLNKRTGLGKRCILVTE